MKQNRLERTLTASLRGVACFDLPTRTLYASDASIFEILPAGVVFPRDTDDLVRLTEVAAQEGVSLTARGGGSGIAGESLGRGLIVELGRFMNRVEGYDESTGEVTVQPGLVLDRLNAFLAQYGRMIGPDPSSAGRCTVGGVVANDATGSHSILYGHTRHHLRGLEAVFADGSLAELGPVPLETACNGAGFPGELARQVPELLERYAGAIAADRPRTRRDRSGYNLEGLVQDGTFNPHLLLAGSEGSLALISRLRLATVPRPRFKRVALLVFDQLTRATDAVLPILEHGPAAVEMIDALMIGLARQASHAYDDLLPPGAAACLLVECQGDSPEEPPARLEAIRQAVCERERLAVGWRMTDDPRREAQLWDLRKAGVPLLFRRPGPTQPVPFVEDVAVPVDSLTEYVKRLSAVFDSHGVQAAFYGHAGGGELHIRPFLDLRRADHCRKLESIAQATCELARSLGGTLSGEHGEGLVRGQFIRQMRPHTYPLFEEIKRIFDPRGLLNPDKIITTRTDLISSDHKLPVPYAPELPELRFNYSQHPYAETVERCNGCGNCRSPLMYSMCPVFKATGLEAASPRAKASVLRNLMYGRAEERGQWERAWKEVYDYCIGCGMCAVECPSAVDIPKLMYEAKVRYAAHNGLDLPGLFLSEADVSCRVLSALAPLANLGSNNRILRKVMEMTAGVDSRRRLPRFSRQRRIKTRSSGAVNGHPKVALFRDLFARYNSPGLAQVTVRLLEELAGAEVTVTDLGSCGITAMAYGNAGSAFRILEKNLEELSGLIDEGYSIVSQEPTSVLTLRVEAPGWSADPRWRAVAANTFELFEYLKLLEGQGKLKLLPGDLRLERKLAYHMPCHLKALQIGQPGLGFLSRVAGLEIVESQAACCGIAGTFGMKKQHFDLSLKIGEKLFQALEAEGVSAGLSECSTCRLQMEQSGKGTYHPAEVLAAALGLENLPSR
ncbi:FAD-binding protein [bacterium]|nr:FAD-binding protein [bacterium]